LTSLWSVAYRSPRAIQRISSMLDRLSAVPL
jgi:hypothetical protein